MSSSWSSSSLELELEHELELILNHELELEFELAHTTPIDLMVVYEAGSLWYDYGTIARRQP